jgi:hypothetical protein
MTLCSGSEHLTELNLVRALYARDGAEPCAGPLLTIAISGRRLELLYESLLTSALHGKLQSALDLYYPNGIAYRLCAAHWIDVTYTAGCQAQICDRPDWQLGATLLIRQICSEGGWDPKELSNLLAWRRVRQN